MGLCVSNGLSEDEKAAARDDRARSRGLDVAMKREQEEEQRINKLLLLGAGESGKSTLFKQMLTIYKKELRTDEERKPFAPIIYNNIITSMKTLCQMSETYGPCNVPHSLQYVEDLKGDEAVDQELGHHLSQLWQDSGIQKTYDMRATYQLTDSASYFFNKIDEVAADDYLPSTQDVLRSRVRTTGIVEKDFEIEGNAFKMYDVGGQRNERKKWIHCFEDVTAVLFVAAISEYDQVLYEDENTNRMAEALNLFQEICNSRWFRKTDMILFLNKEDLFDEKIQRVSLRTCFGDEYKGRDGDAAHAKAFIQDQFMSKNRDENKEVHCFVTSATNTANVTVLFNSVKRIVIKKSLDEAGLT